MVVTEDTYLPTDAELTVQEINLTFPVLQAASLHMGKYCEWKNNEFLLCRKEEKDPRKCLNEGKEVTACALDFFRKIKKHCHEEFKQYYTCIDKSSGEGLFAPCRKTQKVFDKCVLDTLNVERPSLGYFCEVRVHNTDRPKPKRIVIEYPDATPGYDFSKEAPPAKYQSRNYWSH